MGVVGSDGVAAFVAVELEAPFSLQGFEQIELELADIHFLGVFLAFGGAETVGLN